MSEPCLKMSGYGQRLRSILVFMYCELKCEDQQCKKARKEVEGAAEVYKL